MRPRIQNALQKQIINHRIAREENGLINLLLKIADSLRKSL